MMSAVKDLRIRSSRVFQTHHPMNSHAQFQTKSAANHVFQIPAASQHNNYLKNLSHSQAARVGNPRGLATHHVMLLVKNPAPTPMITNHRVLEFNLSQRILIRQDHNKHHQDSKQGPKHHPDNKVLRLQNTQLLWRNRDRLRLLDRETIFLLQRIKHLSMLVHLQAKRCPTFHLMREVSNLNLKRRRRKRKIRANRNRGSEQLKKRVRKNHRTVI